MATAGIVAGGWRDKDVGGARDVRQTNEATVTYPTHGLCVHSAQCQYMLMHVRSPDCSPTQKKPQTTHFKSFNVSNWFTAAHLSPTNLVTHQKRSKINRKGSSPEKTLALQ